MTGSDEHLSQRELTAIDGIDDILELLGSFLHDAKFEKKENGVQMCTDKGLPAAAQQLFTALDFQNKVPSMIPCLL
jgi:hypothetical protein